MQDWERAIADASYTDLNVALDAAQRWGCVPGSLADKMRQHVQQELQGEIDARADVGF